MGMANSTATRIRTLIHRAGRQNETLFGFVAVSTSTGDITSGNLLDAVRFRQYYRMDFQTPPSGSGTYSTDGETPVAFDSAASKSDYALVAAT